MARPRKSRSDKRSASVTVYLTPSEKKRLDAASERAKLPVATLARQRLLQAAD